MDVNDTSPLSPLTAVNRETVASTQSKSQDCPDGVQESLDAVFLFPKGIVIYVQRVPVDARGAFWFHLTRSQDKTLPRAARERHWVQGKAWLARMEASNYPIWALEADAAGCGFSLLLFNLRKKR